MIQAPNIFDMLASCLNTQIALAEPSLTARPGILQSSYFVNNTGLQVVQLIWQT